MKYIDLHTHSNCSDGSMTPTELVKHAAEKGLAAIALSDHDTIAGVDEAIEAIKAGKMTATVKQDGDAMGEANIRFAMNYLINGKWIDGLDQYKLNDDGVSTFIPYAKITQENVG